MAKPLRLQRVTARQGLSQIIHRPSLSRLIGGYFRKRNQLYYRGGSDLKSRLPRVTARQVITVSLSGLSSLPVTVTYATADGTATAGGNDYVPISGTLTFAPGETTETITVVVNPDMNKDADETFFVDLSGAVNALLVDDQGLGIILSDDWK